MKNIKGNKLFSVKSATKENDNNWSMQYDFEFLFPRHCTFNDQFRSELFSNEFSEDNIITDYEELFWDVPASNALNILIKKYKFVNSVMKNTHENQKVYKYDI
jgi:hypothetical protein